MTGRAIKLLDFKNTVMERDLWVVKLVASFPSRKRPCHNETPRGEAVGFQRFRTRVFKVWEPFVG